MAASRFWDPDELGRYLRLFQDVEAAHRERIALIRRRLDTGYYLTDDIARATARKMLTTHGVRFS